MGNHNESVILEVFVFDKDNEKEMLANVVKMDGDYEGMAEEVVEEIMAKHDNLSDRLEAIFNYYHKDIESQFILTNEIFCDGYEYEMTNVENKTIVSIAYRT